jgi:uncharacterized membrane protein YeiH
MAQTNSFLQWWVTNGNFIFETLGILAFALSGLLESARKKLDLVGMVMVTGLAAFGGGTLRDILLDRRPFFWVQNSYWIFIIIGICVFAMLFIRSQHLELTERAVQWPDAIGLGVFSAGGTQIALQAGRPPIVAVILGCMTAIVGGVARDLAVTKIPQVFIDHQPYAVLSFTGSWLVVLGDWQGWPNFVSLWSAAIFIIVLRIAAILRGWRLPTWRL